MGESRRPRDPVMTFDEWRDRYDDLTDAVQLSYLHEIVAEYPDQDRADRKSVRRFLAKLDNPVVHEVGGHDGALARDMHGYRWVNIDPAFGHTKFFWWHTQSFPRATVLVCSHVLEHFKTQDVEGILRAFPSVRHLFVDCPLDETPPDWAGYHGTHIIEVGWRGLHDLLTELGFEHVESFTPHAREYRR